METEPLANGTEPTPEVVQEELPPLSAAELFANRQKKLTEKKRTIALLSSALIENPEQNASNIYAATTHNTRLEMKRDGVVY